MPGRNSDLQKLVFMLAATEQSFGSTGGLTAGAGLEMALLRNLSAKLEYDFIYFGADAINLGTKRNPSNLDHQLHLLKLGLNWRFNGDYLLARN